MFNFIKDLQNYKLNYVNHFHYNSQDFLIFNPKINIQWELVITTIFFLYDFL